MYNRYIPQPDGSFRRSRIPDNQQPSQVKPPPIVEPECPPEAPPVQPRPCRHQQRSAPHKKSQCYPQSKEDTSALTFLRKLLPKEFDTGDLIIVLLLLLMAGDCTEDRNTALLTLALYFFM